MSTVIEHAIFFPEGFDDFAWEAESKGWLQGAVVVIAGKRYNVIFYDPTRLAQDIEVALKESAVFFEPNLLVVPCVTRAHMEVAITTIARTGRFVNMSPQEELSSRVPPGVVMKRGVRSEVGGCGCRPAA